MNKIINGLLAVGSLVLAVSCADYNETYNFTAEPDPTVIAPYQDLGNVKAYTDRSKYPNMTLGTAIDLAKFKEKALDHSAAVANFDEYYFGTAFMSGKVANAKGVLNYYDIKEQLDHIQQVGGKVYGSAIAANAGQADGWLELLTAPIEILVEYSELKTVDYSKGDPFEGKDGTIVKKDGESVLKIVNPKKVNAIEGFKVDTKATYTTQIWLKADKNKTATFKMFFSGTQSVGPASQGRYTLTGSGEWTRFTVEEKPAAGVEDGYLRIEPALGSTVYVRKVQVGYLPDNHRDQTEQEITDTIHYAMETWCDGLMKNCAGRIKSFDLIEEPIGTLTLAGTDVFDLKHSTQKIYWQDIFGSEKYAPVVSDAAVTAFKKYGGNADELKFFIAEKGLEDNKKFESLKYWMDVWTKNGAKIDGINAKLSLTYNEDDNTANVEAFSTLLQKLRDTGKLIRLSNFDITYEVNGEKVAAKDITAAQRQKLADYYAELIKMYLATIAPDKQAGICKGNMVDTSSDPVGLWAIDSKTRDWVRTATYKAFCDALSGK